MSIELKDLPALSFCDGCHGCYPRASWTMDDEGAYCEDCGSHATIVCPACEAHYDIIYTAARDFIVPESEAIRMRMLCGEHDPGLRRAAIDEDPDYVCSRLCYR